TPFRDPGVVAAERNPSNCALTPVGGLLVRRVLQDPVFVRLLHQARVIPDYSVYQPSDRFDHRHRSDLAAVEHVVAEADQTHFAQRRSVVENPLVDALIASTADDEMLTLCQLAGSRLREDLSGGRRKDDRG